MLAIRFARVGRKKKPLYRIVVSEKSKDMYGDYLEFLGTYNPHSKKAELNTQRIKYWLDNGAKPSEVVHNLLVNEKIIEAKKVRVVRISKKRRERMKKSEDDSAKETSEAKEKRPDDAASEEKGKEPDVSKDKPV